MSAHSATTAPLARRLALHAAVLLLLGLFTGGFVAAAMTGKANADAHMALASHLNALLGSFWMFAVAWSLPLLRLSPKGVARLALLTTVANYGNWLITAVKAFLKVSGVEAVGEVRNDTIFGLLTLFVVLPSIAAGATWIYGLSGPHPAQ